MSNFSQMLGNRAEAQRIYEQRKKIKQLERKLQRKDNIIKEVREYIEDKWEMELKDSMEDFLDHDDLIDRKRLLHILEILDKENKE